MAVSTTEIQGENIRAGHYIMINEKFYRVLHNDSDAQGGGTLQLDSNSCTSCAYVNHDNFKVVIRSKN